MKLLCFVLMMTDCQLTRSGPWHFRPLFECAFMGAHSVMNCRTCVVPCSISCVFSKGITELFTNFSLHSLPTFLIVDFLLHVLNIPKKRTDLCIILLLDMAESQCVFTIKYFCFFSFQHTQLFSSWVSLCLCKYLLLVSSQSGQVNTWLRQVCFLI